MTRAESDKCVCLEGITSPVPQRVELEDFNRPVSCSYLQSHHEETIFPLFVGDRI